MFLVIFLLHGPQMGFGPFIREGFGQPGTVQHCFEPVDGCGEEKLATAVIELKSVWSAESPYTSPLSVCASEGPPVVEALS
jgi:hypothetical protein